MSMPPCRDWAIYSASRHHELSNKVRAMMEDLKSCSPQEWMLNALSEEPDTVRKTGAAGVKVCPSVIGGQLTEDRQADDITSAFLSWVAERREFNFALIPSGMAWLVITPKGKHYFIFRWSNPETDTLSLFGEFCKATGRSFAVIEEGLQCQTETEKFSLFDCRLIHEREFLNRVKRLSRPMPAGKAVEAANDLLAKRMRREHKNVLEQWEFLSDEEVKDKELRKRVETSFKQKFETARKKLEKEFGPPNKTGSTQHADIPCNGVLHFAIWKVGRKRFYLVASHEEREMPVQLLMGRC